MATQVPPKRGAAFAFDVNLVSQADTDVFKSTVTLAAGDIQVSKDGGQYANLATFPPAERDLAAGADSGTLRVQLTAAEMTADTVTVLFHDAAGNEWQDLLVTIHTVTTSQIDDLATAADLATVDANVDAVLADTGTDGVVVAAASKTGYALSAAGVDAIHDEVVEGAYTLRQILRLLAAAIAGEAIGGGTATITFTGLDGVTDRIVATVDANGNRSSMTLDVT